MPTEEIFAKGKLFELVHLTQPDGRVFEVARRAPGVRIIIADRDNQKVLLTKEIRRELETPDYRLPGVDKLELVKKSTVGATVEWDLFVFEAGDWKQSDGGQQLEAGEQIEADNWFTYDEAEAMILNGAMQEERIALILLQWIEKQKEGKKL